MEINLIHKKQTDEEDYENVKKLHKQYPDVFPIAERLEGRIRGAGAHAAGMVVSKEPLWRVCPIETRKEYGAEGRTEVTAFPMEEVEDLGLIKVDILGVKAVSVVRDAIEKIKELHGIDVTQTSLDLNDENVIENFNTDNMLGVFQAEGAGYKNLLSQMTVDSFSDIVASSALVRPGALFTQGDQYLKCKRGSIKPQYAHELLRPILEETYGAFVYQEQLMQAAVALAGFSWSEADVLRKIVGKKRDAKEFLPLKQKWLDGASKNISEQQARDMWENFETSSMYVFNKSHAVGYSMLTYQTMWLKYYYPTEFIWALVRNENEKQKVAGYLFEASRMGITVLPPDINSSDAEFALDNGNIRFGLRNVAGCGGVAVKEIMAKRPFRSFEEFREKCRAYYVRSNLIENLEKIGAFESVGHNSGYDYKKYYLPVLDYPLYEEDDAEFKNIISPCADVIENSTDIWVVKGLVKSTKRGGHYFRVELEDVSGVISCFGSKDMTLKTRDYVIALVGDKTLIAYWDIANGTEEDPFYEFLNMCSSGSDGPYGELLSRGAGGIDDEKTLFQVVRVRPFKNKKGKLMANVYGWSPQDRVMVRFLAFEKQFGKYVDLMTPWRWVLLSSSLLHSGDGRFINAMLDVETMLEDNNG